MVKTDNTPKLENLFMTDLSFGVLKEQDQIYREGGKNPDTWHLNTCITQELHLRFYHAKISLVN
jgi:hypothetical protein